MIAGAGPPLVETSTACDPNSSVAMRSSARGHEASERSAGLVCCSFVRGHEWPVPLQQAISILPPAAGMQQKAGAAGMTANITSWVSSTLADQREARRRRVCIV